MDWRFYYFAGIAVGFFGSWIFKTIKETLKEE